MSPDIKIQVDNNPNPVYKRIGWGTNFLMIIFAVIIDVSQVLLDFIPFVGWILSSLLAGFGFFILWFIWKLNGVSFWERLGGKYGRKFILRFGGSALLETLLSFVPALTVLVITTNSLIRTEDKLVKEGYISREELDRIGEILVERDLQNRKQLLKVAREEAKRFAERKAVEKIESQVDNQRQYVNQVVTNPSRTDRPYKY